MFPLQLRYTFQASVPKVASYFINECMDKTSQIFRTVEHTQHTHEAAEAPVVLTFESIATCI